MGSYFSTFLILLGSLLMSLVLMRLVAPRKIRPVTRQYSDYKNSGIAMWIGFRHQCWKHGLSR